MSAFSRRSPAFTNMAAAPAFTTMAAPAMTTMGATTIAAPQQVMQQAPFAATNIGVLKERSDADTIIIWDWDDTLMCTNDIFSQGYAKEVTHGIAQTNGGGPISELEGLIEKCLTTSMSLGETFIVTNADEAWLWDTARRFAPHCLPLLSQVPILSAKDKYQKRLPDDPFAWKRETFNEIFSSRCHPHGMNLIVLGDSDCEIQAAWTATRQMPADSLRVKTIKFKEEPTCDELFNQQNMMVRELAAIVVEEKDINRNLAWGLSTDLQGQQQYMQQAPVQTMAAPAYMQQAPVQTIAAPQMMVQQAAVQTMAAPQYIQQAPVQSFAAPQMMVQQAPLQTMAAPQYIQQAQTLAPTSMMRGASFGTNMIRGASFGTATARAW